jgi:hypothetical protein
MLSGLTKKIVHNFQFEIMSNPERKLNTFRAKPGAIRDDKNIILIGRCKHIYLIFWFIAQDETFPSVRSIYYISTVKL